MKLARIDHIRCGEYSGCTLVWVDESMTENELQERVEAAEKDYLDALKAFAELEQPKPLPTQPDWKNQRDRNVGEVLDEHAAATQAAKQAYDARRAALRPFDTYLERYEGIQNFWDHEFALAAEVDWGHQHGTQIEYGETDWPIFRLLKPSQTRQPGRPVIRVVESEEWL